MKIRLKEFFLRNKITTISDEDINILMRRLDLDGDGKISYYEFIDATTPTAQEKKLKNKLSSNDKKIEKTKSSQKIPEINQKGNNNELNVKVYDRQIQTQRDSITKDKSKDIDAEELVEISKKPTKNTYPLEEKLSYRKQAERDENMANRNAAINVSISFRTPSPLKNTPEKSSNKRINNDTISTKLSLTMSPMKGNEEEYLAIALKNQLDLDKELEIVRENLAIKTDFNLMDAFRFFDSNGKGFITSSELDQTLRSFDIFANTTEIYLFMRRFDADGDGLLRYSFT